MSQTESKKYLAFISYRHADNAQQDRQWASWLHKALETYQVPEELVGTINQRGEIIPDRIYPVFRDEAELPAHADLASAIELALQESAFLVVLCSPRAAESKYVAQEIDYFKRLGHSDRIIAAIIDGEPNVSLDESKLNYGYKVEDECFPWPLQYEYDKEGKTSKQAEPIAANFRILQGGKHSEGWPNALSYKRHLKETTNLSSTEINKQVEAYRAQHHSAFLGLVAGILGVSKGELTERDQEYRLELANKRNRILIAGLVVSFVFLCLLSFFWWKTEKLYTSNLIAESFSNMRLAAEFNENEEYDSALFFSLKALPDTAGGEGGKRPLIGYTAPFFTAYQNNKLEAIYKHKSGTDKLSVGQKGGIIITAPSSDEIILWDSTQAKKIKQTNFSDHMFITDIFVSTLTNKVVVVFFDNFIYVLNLEDLSVFDSFPFLEKKRFLLDTDLFYSTISRDGRYFVSMSGNGAILVYDLTGSTPPDTVIFEELSRITEIAIGDDGKLIFATKQDGLFVSPLDNPRKISKLSDLALEKFMLTGGSLIGKRYIEIAGKKKSFLVFIDVENDGKLIKELGLETDGPLKITKNGFIATASVSQGRLTFIDKSGNINAEISLANRSYPEAFVLSNDGTKLAIKQDGFVYIYDAINRALLDRIKIGDIYTKISFSPSDESIFVYGNNSELVKQFKVKVDEKKSSLITNLNFKAFRFSLSGRGDEILIANKSGPFEHIILDTKSYQIQKESIAFPGLLDHDDLNLSQTGRFVVLTWLGEDKSGNISIFDRVEKKIFELKFDKRMEAIAFSDDDRLMATTGRDRKVRVYSTDDFKLIHPDNLKRLKSYGEILGLTNENMWVSDWSGNIKAWKKDKEFVLIGEYDSTEDIIFDAFKSISQKIFLLEFSDWIKIHELDDFMSPCKLPKKAGVLDVSFDETNRVVHVLYENQKLESLSIENCNVLREAKHNAIHIIDIQDKSVLFSIGHKEIRMWDRHKLQMKQEISLKQCPKINRAFSSDEGLLLICDDGKVFDYQLDSLESFRPFKKPLNLQALQRQL
ncbi:toll/interleukin-1 receptor domain-containing protein [Planctobacterium marinum]|uniref:TIR domain-containing protein n=1 Tax=Planctobacterium marinum TaxID=1631968 RepID=A0AA48KPV6_9ALTE|nr:hypothetical protein MACH26_13890 [Planctobacterium marinum]